MSEQILGHKLGQVDIKQTRPIRFKDETINKIKNTKKIPPKEPKLADKIPLLILFIMIN